ncbi:MAG: hypothetical protein WC436_00780 [Candidatus Babeliales bacterium]
MSNKKFLIFIFIFSFLLRAAFFYCFLSKNNNCWVCVDSAEYIDISKNIYENKGILKSDGDFNFRRLPGYPIFLSLCYKICNKESINFALYIQILLSCFIPILIFFLTLILFPNNILLAKLAAIFSSINLGFILHSGLILSETLFILFFLLFLIFFYKYLEFFCDKNNFKKIFLAGLFLGITSLIRPTGLYLLILSILILFLCANINFVNKLKNIFLFFISWLIPVLPWLLRNYLLTGFIFLHTLPGIHFLIYTAAFIDSDINKCEYFESKQKLLNKWQELIIKNKAENSDIKSCILAENLASEYIKKHPLSFIKHSCFQVLKTIFGLNSATLLFIDSKKLPNYNSGTSIFDKIKRFLIPNLSNKIFLIFIYLEIIIYFFILFGFILFLFNYLISFNLIKYAFLFKTVSFIILFLFLTLAYGVARLRLPVEPLIIILSFYYWLNKFKIRKLYCEK